MVKKKIDNDKQIRALQSALSQDAHKILAGDFETFSVKVNKLLVSHCKYELVTLF